MREVYGDVPAIYHKLIVIPPYGNARYVSPQTFGPKDNVYPTLEIRGKEMVVGGSKKHTANYYGQGTAVRLYLPGKGPLQIRAANSTGKPIRLRVRYERDR